MLHIIGSISDVNDSHTDSPNMHRATVVIELAIADIFTGQYPDSRATTRLTKVMNASINAPYSMEH